MDNRLIDSIRERGVKAGRDQMDLDTRIARGSDSSEAPKVPKTYTGRDSRTGY